MREWRRESVRVLLPPSDAVAVAAADATTAAAATATLAAVLASDRSTALTPKHTHTQSLSHSRVKQDERRRQLSLSGQGRKAHTERNLSAVSGKERRRQRWLHQWQRQQRCSIRESVCMHALNKTIHKSAR